MCWNLEVTIAFACLDALAVVFLLWRNGLNDRLFAMYAMPIAVQECLQIVLWLNIGEDEYQCNRVNRVTSFIVRLVVMFVPLTGTLLGVLAKRARDQPPTALKHQYRWVIVMASAAFTFGAMALWAWRFLTYPAQGTVIGPNHHQVWPHYYASNADILESEKSDRQNLKFPLPLFLYVLFACGPILLYVRPLWLAHGLAVPISTLAMVFYLIYPLEYESVWCWSGTVIMAFAVLQAYVPVSSRSTRYKKVASQV